MMWRLLAACLLRMRNAWWQTIYNGYRSRYTIDPGFRFNGAGIQLYGEGRIELAERSYVGELSTIQACRGHAVRIGPSCRISHNVRIYTETSRSDTDFRLGDGALLQADVNVGAGAWIGANVFIGPGIAIGANAVVGANSVVTQNVPADEIWAGVPARFVRRKQQVAQSQ
jgi:maltose O-acetyltransferase